MENETFYYRCVLFQNIWQIFSVREFFIYLSFSRKGTVFAVDLRKSNKNKINNFGETSRLMKNVFMNTFEILETVTTETFQGNNLETNTCFNYKKN